MGTKPFKVAGDTTAPSITSVEETPAPAPGVAFVASRDKGQPIPEPDKAHAHGHSTPIPWPDAQYSGVGSDSQHKPMKLPK